MEGARGLGGDVVPGGAAGKLAMGQQGVGLVHAVQQPVAGLMTHGAWGRSVQARTHPPAGLVSIGPVQVLAAGGAVAGACVVPTPCGMGVVGAAVVRAVLLGLLIPVHVCTEPSVHALMQDSTACSKGMPVAALKGALVLTWLTYVCVPSMLSVLWGSANFRNAPQQNDEHDLRPRVLQQMMTRGIVKPADLQEVTLLA